MDSPATLKRTALGGELISLECDALGPTLAALQDAPGVRDCAVFGNALHILVADAQKSLQELPRFLEREGLRAGRAARIAPSLEDIFVQLVAADGAIRRATA
jgi:ABC-2 type transport system ATP-binding protein